MKNIKIVLLLLLIAFLVVSCTKEENVETLNNTKNNTSTIDNKIDKNAKSEENTSEIPLLNLNEIHWTNEEKTFIHDLNKKGSIKIATKISEIVYMPQKDGSITGVHYNVLKVFADLAEIKIDVKLVEWSDLFYKEGEDIERVKTDPDYTYVPTLLEEIDILLAGVTVLQWREKMMDFIKFIPNRQMIVSKKNNKPKTIQDLNNKTIYLMKNTSMEQNLNILKMKNNLKINYLYTDNLDLVAEGVSKDEADFTILDSDMSFGECYKYKNLTISMPISEIEILGWPINKNNTLLKSVIEKYLRYAQDKNILDKYWLQQYGVSFVDYLKIIQLE